MQKYLWWQHKKIVVWILILILLPRLVLFFYALFFNPQGYLLFDSYGYIALTENYLEHDVYSQSISSPFYPDLFRPPGYPFFIGLAYFIYHHPISIVLFQLLLSFFSGIVLVNCIQLFQAKNPLRLTKIGLVIFALDIPSIVLSNLVMSETLFCFLLLLFLFYFLRYFHSERKWDLFWSGLCLGCATLVRPISLYLPLFLLVFFILHYRKLFFKQFAVLALGFLLVISPWLMRNYYHHNTVFFTYISSFNLLYFQAASIYADEKNISLADARYDLYAEVYAEMYAADQVEPIDDPINFYQRIERKAIAIIATHPLAFTKNVVMAEINLWFRPCRGYLAHLVGSNKIFQLEKRENQLIPVVVEEKKTSRPLIDFLVVLQILFSLFLFVTFFIGLKFIKASDMRKLASFLFMVWLYFAVTASGPEAEARFRVPVIPLMSIVSALTINYFIGKREQRNLN